MNMIVSNAVKPEDWNRVGNKLSQYTKERRAPRHEPLSFLFQERAGRAGVRGEAVITQNWGKIDIDLLFVEERHRRKGIGKALVEAITRFGCIHGVKAVRVSTPTWQGEGFYEHIGFTEMGRIPLANDDFGMPQAEITYFKILPSVDGVEQFSVHMPAGHILNRGITSIVPALRLKV